MRKNFVADRVRDKEDMAYVEEKGRALQSFRRSENGVIMSGDKKRLEKNPGGRSSENKLPEEPLLGA